MAVLWFLTHAAAKLSLFQDTDYFAIYYTGENA